MMEIIHQSRIDRELESLMERIYPPRVCIDNDSREECTVVKVDSANKDGILLEMVQVLTDLDLVISKSFISSDGGWFMDVFHVTDSFGNKLIDESLMLYIQKALCASRRGEISREKLGNSWKEEERVWRKKTAVELTGTDGPGLLSEISAVLVELGFKATSATAWTHNDRAACIIHVEDDSTSGPIDDPIRLAHVERHLECVLEARGEKRSVRLTTLAAGRTHTERRLHQLMYADRDYERCRACEAECGGEHKKECDGTHVWIGRCEEKGYWGVNVRSRDRPKLLFDTLCVLTDMNYVVFHAAIRSAGSMAHQEYFVRHKASSTLLRESERQKLTLCLIAAIERRVSHGLRIDINTENRVGLMRELTRVFRENGLWISRVEIGTRGDKAEGSFYVTDSAGGEVNPKIVELVRQQAGGSIVAVHRSPCRMSTASSSSSTREHKSGIEAVRKFSLGSMLWSQLERLSDSFGSIRSSYLAYSE
ncbi:ACT domain-containing protein ACR1 [Neltuma alba]|uniref:ACT domain-containing protein ACR1 n=1 Tax=Neltuma alba TaxID=207710 RepID=UPI0010A56BA3|nr:ACT domain-containing protein ACR1-like [Prosopis alba]XP_028764246.1 ACT domain-containing protein ACR1-like [Prosopis alba]XP_028764248.1 ACT domain-containing protein ACR1-like [Prosopis alba]